MIDPPVIVDTVATDAAVIALVIPRSAMPAHFGAAIGEIMVELGRQGIAATGPVVAHHLRMPPGMFDFEIAIPVARPIMRAGRVEPRHFASRTVARTVHHGDYPDLHGAWTTFAVWLEAHGHAVATDLFETYLTGPAQGLSAAEYRTQLDRPLA